MSLPLAAPVRCRNLLHNKYVRVLRLSEAELRWCERLSAMTLQPLTIVLIRFAKTRQSAQPGSSPRLAAQSQVSSLARAVAGTQGG